MGTGACWKLLSLLGMLLLGAGGPLGCMPAGRGGGSNFVTGRITPGHFRFQDITSIDLLSPP